MSTIKPGDVMLTKSCRMVRVLASRDDGAVAMRDYRSRVAVRSVDTDRLSYHSEHELTLVQPPATPQEPTGASPQAETSEQAMRLRDELATRILCVPFRGADVKPSGPYLLLDDVLRVMERPDLGKALDTCQLAPVSPVEPEPPTVECCACGHLNTPQQATRLEGEWRSSGEYVCLDSDACSRRIAKCSEPTVEPEPCVWRADWREGRDGSILVPSCQPEMEIDAAFVQECVQLHGWKFCVHCGAPLKVEREP